jgi:methyltransferase
MHVLVLTAIVFVPMLIEARRAAANERRQRSRGGVEAPGDVYRIMQVAYPAAFLSMIGEAALRGGPSRDVAIAGAVVFGLAKALKWWAITTLGSAWTFRVITVPGSTLVASGPYTIFRHPNYIAVAGELVGTALLTGALVAGPLATLIFVVLMLKRITVEDRALGRSDA